MVFTYTDLLARLKDLKQLAIQPIPGERSGCVSSFDRRSQYLADQDCYVDWDANDDGKGFERALDDGSVVALELNGPGVIWRSWSAMPNDGHIRFYIDGELAIDTPFIRYFTGFGEDFAPLNVPSVCPHISRGYNSFVPVPFQKSIRIELSEGWGAYYHFTYTTYPEGTVMPDYCDLFTRPGRVTLAEVDRALWLREPQLIRQPVQLMLAPHSTEVVLDKHGSGAIEDIQLRLDDPVASKKVLIRLYWDGETAPSVCAPLCDFFGTSAALNPFKTLAVGNASGTLYSRWFMPFASGARLTLENLSDVPVGIEAAVRLGDCANANQLLRFHAKFHGDAFEGLDRSEFEPGGQRFPDWPVLRTTGSAGRFCGMHLSILDTWVYPGNLKSGEWWFGYDGCERLDWWWGEGDEKFFVDGEKFPSTFGTGSEDYFGYAWAAEPPFALFDSPFAANSDMPLDGNGITSVCRFHVADNIPFMNGFEAYIEKYKGNNWGENNRCVYGATAYWYQQQGTQDGYKEPTLTEVEATLS